MVDSLRWLRQFLGVPKNHDKQDELADAVCRLACAVTESLEWFKSHLNFVTPNDLLKTQEKIMSVISEFASKQNAFNTRQGTAIDAVATSVEGITGDVKALNDKITELQNSSGGVTPEDQALIDALVTQGDALTAKLEATSTALATLDALTPPTPPPA